MDRSIVFGETFMRDVFQNSNLDIFNELERLFILKKVNRMMLNSIPLDLEDFTNFKDFLTENES